MKKALLSVVFGLVAFAQQMPVYPADALEDLLRHQHGIVEKAMIRACEKAKDRYIAGFVVKFDENGDFIIKAITIKKGGEI